MGRSAAITGPTPSFVRWAIEWECPLRDLKLDRLPDTTYRQLRGIRELSCAIRENRCVDNTCLHPASTLDSIDSTLGFFIDEVEAPFGGLDFIDRCCSSCPANAGRQEIRSGSSHDAVHSNYVGCFGWISNDPKFQLDKVSRGLDSNSAEVMDTTTNLEERLANLSSDPAWSRKLKDCFPPANHIWYRIWRERVPNRMQLQVIQQLLLELVKGKTANDSFPCTDLVQLINAISVCLERSKPLHLEFVPAGHSDGNLWRIDPHCPSCKYGLGSDVNLPNCPMCGSDARFVDSRTSKVLGIRPYLKLVQILGAEETTKRVERLKKPNRHP